MAMSVDVFNPIISCFVIVLLMPYVLLEVILPCRLKPYDLV